MPRPSSDSDASTRPIASEIVGVAGKLVVKVENSVEPMPTMTASTSTFTPEDMTLPSTRSAAKAVLPNRPKGISTKPQSVDNLNSIRLTKSWIASTKNEISTIAQANSSTVIWMKFSKKLTKPISPEIDCRIGWPASRPTCATRPGRRKSASAKPVPDALRPRAAKLSNTALDSICQLPIR